MASSEVGTYDGPGLERIAYTPGVSTLNNIIDAIDNVLKDIYDNKFLHIKSSQVDDFDGTHNYADFTVSGTLNEAIDDIATFLQGVNTTLKALKTSQVDFDAPVPANYTPSVDPLILKLNKYLKGIDDKFGATDTTITTLTTLIKLYDHLSAFVADYVVSGATPVVVGLNVTLSKINCFIDGKRFEIDTTVIALQANKDNYIDIKFDQTYNLQAVALGNPAPPIEDMRLWKFVTDGVGVTAQTDLRNFRSFSGAQLLDNTVTTAHIQNLGITTDKLADTAVTPGSYPFGTFTVDAKGRISAASSPVTIAAPALKDLLLYDTGTGKWLNAPFVGNLLPITSDGYVLRFNAGLGIYEGVAPSVIDDYVDIKVTITNVNVLQLNSVPVEAVLAPGAGKAVRCVYLSGNALFSGGDIAYDTNIDLVAITDTATHEQATIGGANGLLTSTAARHVIGKMVTVSDLAATTNTQIIENKALLLKVKTADPLNGTFDIEVFLRYKIITI